MTEATWELLEWHDTSFWRLSHVKQSPLACIFYILFATKFLNLSFKNKDVQKFPQIRGRDSNHRFRQFHKQPSRSIHFKTYTEQLNWLQLDQPILIIYFIFFYCLESKT